MADTKTSSAGSSQKTNPDINPIGVGIAGAIAGAALGAVAAVVLSDQETRKKVQKNMKVLKDTAIRVMDAVEDAKDKPTLREKVHIVDDALTQQDATTRSK